MKHYVIKLIYKKLQNKSNASLGSNHLILWVFLPLLPACLFFFSFSPTNCETSTARVTGNVINLLCDLALKAVQKAFNALSAANKQLTEKVTILSRKKS